MSKSLAGCSIFTMILASAPASAMPQQIGNQAAPAAGDQVIASGSGGRPATLRLKRRRRKDLQAPPVQLFASEPAGLPHCQAVGAGPARESVGPQPGAPRSRCGGAFRPSQLSRERRIDGLSKESEPMAYKIAIIVGSLRKDSLNRKVARSICAHARRQSRLLDDRDRRPAALQPGPRRQSARAMDPLPRAGRRGRRRAVRQPRI